MNSHPTSPFEFSPSFTRAAPTTIGGQQQHPMQRPTSNAMSGALQHTSGNESRTSAGASYGSSYRFGNNRDSMPGAEPISMQNASNQSKPRRESMAGSMVTGMSWGGASVGSWIRDDIMMQGTSPFPYQSPSFHSSSYQPKLEADFMRDFSCCGLTLPTLHDLMEHYEEFHSSQMEELQKRAAADGAAPDPKAAIANNAAALKDSNQIALQQQQQQQQRQRLQQEQQQLQQQQQQQQRPSSSGTARPPSSSAPHRSNTPTTGDLDLSLHSQSNHPRHPQSTSQEEETVGRMEMEEDFAAAQNAMGAGALGGQYPTSAAQQSQAQQHKLMQNNGFGARHSSPHSPIDLGPMNGGGGGGNPLLQHQGLRISTPNTPTSSRSTPFFHNPTVSSVNTPTLTTHPGVQSAQQQQAAYFTPNSSTPGTPSELDPEFVGNMGSMNMGYMGQTSGFGNWGYTSNADMLDLCIDEPAKRLFTSGGSPFNATSSPTQGNAQLAGPAPTTAPGNSALQLGDGQYSENSELARTIREQQKLAGVPDPSADGVPKPFHCPVIGCEKAYKNQNGLKYHKAHGHNSQTLHANPNGTFSIVDPDTLKPFPGTLGMEKHKPYQCQTCGKRYKNLNGLKYHKAHSPTCDPEIRGLNSTSGSAANSKRNSMEVGGNAGGSGGNTGGPTSRNASGTNIHSQHNRPGPTSSPHTSTMGLPQTFQHGLLLPAGEEDIETDDEDFMLAAAAAAANSTRHSTPGLGSGGSHGANNNPSRHHPYHHPHHFHHHHRGLHSGASSPGASSVGGGPTSAGPTSGGPAGAGLMGDFFGSPGLARAATSSPSPTSMGSTTAGAGAHGLF